MDLDGRLASMGALDVMRESVTLIRANSSTFMSMMMVLICPVSFLLLSRVYVLRHVTDIFTGALSQVASSAGFLHYLSLVETLYKSLSQALVSYMLAAPIVMTMWLLAKSSVVLVVASTLFDNKRKKMGPQPMFALVSAGARAWKRALITYLWSCSIVLGFALVGSLMFLFAVAVLHALQFSADLIFLTELGFGILYSLVFAHLMVLGNFAITTSILEELCGFPALITSFHLLKGKIQVALSIFFISMVISGIVENLYQYRVMGIPPSNYAITTESRMWEGPLLVLMHSFLMLLDAVMGCVLYISCVSETNLINESNASVELSDV